MDFKKKYFKYKYKYLNLKKIVGGGKKTSLELLADRTALAGEAALAGELFRQSSCPEDISWNKILDQFISVYPKQRMFRSNTKLKQEKIHILDIGDDINNMNGNPIIETTPSGLYIKFNYNGIDYKLSLHYTENDVSNRFHLENGKNKNKIHFKIQKYEHYPFISFDFRDTQNRDRFLLNLSNFLFFKLQQNVFEIKKNRILETTKNQINRERSTESRGEIPIWRRRRLERGDKRLELKNMI